MFQLEPSAIKCSNQNEFNFVNRLCSLVYHCSFYTDKNLISKALSVIPVETIKQRAETNYKNSVNKIYSLEDEIVKSLLHWFKNEFFTWVNTPPCDHCNHSTTKYIGNGNPTIEEKKWIANVVEIYQCIKCNQYTRFPRYNHVGKLLETKRGRCGEWANTFTMCVSAMGFDARYVMDWTDHVWTEVYSKNLKRWVHCDACENAFDAPQMYESGWGKKLNYIIAFSTEEVVDVTKRYTKQWNQILQRRKLVDEEWLKNAISIINYQLSIFQLPFRNQIITQRQLEEQNEFKNMKNEIKNLQELQGRISGSQV